MDSTSSKAVLFNSRLLKDQPNSTTHNQLRITDNANHQYLNLFHFKVVNILSPLSKDAFSLRGRIGHVLVAKETGVALAEGVVRPAALVAEFLEMGALGEANRSSCEGESRSGKRK